ncbi:MAG: glutamate 5-kinase [Anaerolineales bacterium]|nr:glutamate 5-kinase [Anaerolineales bacterium]
MSQQNGTETSTYKRIVVKLGTSVLTSGTRQLNQPAMIDIVRQCVELHALGHEIIICSSGAITAGRERLGFPDLPATVTNKQMLAAVGQSRLILVWERLFEIYGIHVGQILLTRADFEFRNRYLNARDTLNTLIDYRIVPIINENDAIATEEIKVGDNDNLSAMTATIAGADLMIMLTDQPGLFTADPRFDPNAQLISEVEVIDETLKQLAGASGSSVGTGGMITKLQAADVARRNGINAVIAAGKEPNVLIRLVRDQEMMGTRFPALQHPLESRKQWILAGSKPNGKIMVDDGAVHALCKNGRSLLPAGITAVWGDFERGDTVRILAADGAEIGRGITRYRSQDLSLIAGCQSDEIDQKLGYAYGPVAIHRNDFILLVDS